MRIIVFPDGETFNTIDGCTYHEVPDDYDVEDIERYLQDENVDLTVCDATFFSTWEDGVVLGSPALVLPDGSIEITPIHMEGMSSLVDEYIEIDGFNYNVECSGEDGKYYVKDRRPDE